MRFHGDRTRAHSQIIGQPKDHLSKVEVGHQPHILRDNVVGLIITVDEIHDDRRSRLALRQLEIHHKQNDSRISIGS